MKSLQKPVLTEKSAQAMATGLYVFAITKAANKITVAKEIKSVYGVDPEEVRIVNLPAKQVNFKRKKGLRSIRRKAYIQLPKGQTIAGFEALQQKEEKKGDK